jgi:anti-sigma regulatory factor (Ser/Thr protein kinase)
VVDDVLFRPVERIELSARVQSLLRARALSLRAQRLSSLYEHERLIAQRMQDAALPRLPEIAGLTLDAVYRPADDAARVGGDWYDVLRLTNGLIVVTIGDVSGSGLDAAVAMSHMRQVLRAVANVHSDPALMLDAAERTLTSDDLRRELTCFVGVVDLVDEELTYASAGHPPPLVRDASARVDVLACDGMMLGTTIRTPREARTVPFRAESMLVLYTDGVTEAEHDPVRGELRLRAATAALAMHEPHPAVVLADAMRVATARDDVALLTARYSGAGTRDTLLRWSFDARDADRGRASQAAVRESLRDRGLAAASITLAETILAELLGNVVRHAPGPVEVVLDIANANPILSVLDRGAGFAHFPKLPNDLLSERGRGLFIVSQLAEEFAVQRRTGNGSHARVVLPSVAARPAKRGPEAPGPN